MDKCLKVGLNLQDSFCQLSGLLVLIRLPLDSDESDRLKLVDILPDLNWLSLCFFA